MFPGIIRVVACGNASFPFKAEDCFVEWLGHLVFMHSSASGHWKVSYLLTFVNMLL